MYNVYPAWCEVWSKLWVVMNDWSPCHYTVTSLAAAELWIVNTKTRIGTKTPHSSFLIFAFCTFTSGLKHFDLTWTVFYSHGERGGNDVRRPLLNLRPRNIVCVSSLLSTYYHPLKPFLTKCVNNFHISVDLKVVDCFGQNVYQNDERPHKIFNYTSAVSRADKFQRQLTICFWTCQINPTNQFLLQLYFLSSA